ncbi:hypothetical protein [uncultured Halomonas sp.]|uniref:hypothetical protein n=1 Tax=uncultured Halomonas sp. TaxID=173971 RepID=UPI002629A64E|nr:hypothetical protein [uncultured Halomonas sp.]
MTDQDIARPTDHDSPWKDALESYFEEFTQLLFPAIHAGVDWSRGYTFQKARLRCRIPLLIRNIPSIA